MLERIRLKNALLLTEEGELLTRRDLYVKDGVIEKICGTDEDVPEKREYADCIDCSDYVVSPGLVNLHAHTAMNIFKGIAEDVPSDVWFNERIFPYESRMTPDDIYAGTMLGIAEMINNGVTAAADHYFGEAQVLAAALDTGIRLDIAPTIFGTAPDFQERLAQVREFISSHLEDSDRIALRFGPHSCYLCPGDTLGEVVDAAKAMNLPIHLHMSEEEAQVVTSRKLTGRTPFAVLRDAGGLDIGVIAAHGLWIEEEEVQLTGKETWFAFCPKTYMKLAMGKGGFYRLYDRLNFSFGTDGAASSNTLSPVEQARLFALMEKFDRSDARAADAQSVWKILMRGHKALPFGTGMLQEGAPADLVIWDLWTPDSAAFYNPLGAILYSSNSSNVRFTMVGGEFLKYDGVLKMDLKGLMQDVKRLQQSLLERGKGKAQVFYG